MTADLATVLAEYARGLDDELRLLALLDEVASRQQSLPNTPEPADLTSLGAERARHLSALTALELQLTPRREQIASRLAEARQIAGFADVAEGHRRAAELVARIVARDAESLAVLEGADRDRRDAAHSIETGEATLAAYRRTLQQPASSAGLFTRRG